MRTSKLGLIFSLAYLAITMGLIISQGIFGESFITLILGFPWSLIPAYFEYGGASGPMLYVLALAPIALNAILLYWIGRCIDKERMRKLS